MTNPTPAPTQEDMDAADALDDALGFLTATETPTVLTAALTKDAS